MQTAERAVKAAKKELDKFIRGSSKSFGLRPTEVKVLPLTPMAGNELLAQWQEVLENLQRQSDKCGTH